MICRGADRGDGPTTVLGSYAAPPGPDWGWRIEIAIGDELRITHTNIAPYGKGELAAGGVYSRA